MDYKLIAIVRSIYGQDRLNLTKALYEGGIRLMEVIFDQSKRECLNQTLDTVKLMTEEMGDKIAFGAGTVISLEMLELAKVPTYEIGQSVVKALRRYGVDIKT